MLPMNRPTAIELWNFLIIIVPPTDKATRSSDDVIQANPSAGERVDTTHNDIKVKSREIARMEYHQPAISLREDPPHKSLVSADVNLDMIDIILNKNL
mmetsp:Transcript_20877/g.21200  ORF Transcript_20877/g.21200 Transcript_20877/m.21200 type:complete len:98 (+) Transcript_20877:305-598(+)